MLDPSFKLFQCFSLIMGRKLAMPCSFILLFWSPSSVMISSKSYWPYFVQILESCLPLPGTLHFPTSHSTFCSQLKCHFLREAFAILPKRLISVLLLFPYFLHNFYLNFNWLHPGVIVLLTFSSLLGCKVWGSGNMSEVSSMNSQPLILFLVWYSGHLANIC